VGAQIRIAYGLADPDTGLVVYAERAIPADRRAPVDRDSAFAGLDYAIYLGASTDLDDMATTNVAPRTLPLTGLTYKTQVPFGDTVLTLVTRPHDHLGSDLGKQMPWLVLLAGLLLTASSVAVARQVLRSRARAESDTRTITALYRNVDALYAEQRELSVRLQRALLPRLIPTVPGFDIAAEYLAGGKGIDIGGDWYSVIEFGESHFAFVVGDVSGHGIDAVAEMARARFTLRAYLVDGNSPRVALRKCARQFDVVNDGHMVTVIAGVGDWRTGEVTIASAGHPPPLLITADGADFISVPVGPPLGTGPNSYEEATVRLEEGSTVVCYTDGLIERRAEDIDAGMARLAQFAARERQPQPGGLDAFVTRLLASMRTDESSDDIAVLALERTRP
jgi:serine phosphatase RsbU (regulator of sigma subunit)